MAVRHHRFRVILMALLAGAVLSGCAQDARKSQAIEWIQQEEAAKKRLDEAGFPQYNGQS